MVSIMVTMVVCIEKCIISFSDCFFVADIMRLQIILTIQLNHLDHSLNNLLSFFRRVLQLLAAGIFLPGSVGIIDPCEVRGHYFNVKVHRTL